MNIRPRLHVILYAAIFALCLIASSALAQPPPPAPVVAELAVPVAPAPPQVPERTVLIIAALGFIAALAHAVPKLRKAPPVAQVVAPDAGKLASDVASALAGKLPPAVTIADVAKLVADAKAEGATVPAPVMALLKRVDSSLPAATGWIRKELPPGVTLAQAEPAIDAILAALAPPPVKA